MKKILNLFILFITLLIIPVNVNASNGYTIDKYDININVNENNSFNIEENITVNFNALKHGIYRIIPTKNEIKRLDGTSSNNISKIKNIYVNDKFTINKELEYQEIIIGSEDLLVTGNKQYIIKYDYLLGNDPLKDIDELYYNIIGNNWDTSISNITFTITMPKSFDISKIGFSSGEYGTIGNNYIEYDVNDNIISGKYNGTLNPHEALTIRAELPEGYFTKSLDDATIYTIISCIIILLILFICYALWIKYGKSDSVVETVEVSPPNNLNSLDLALIYKKI